MNRRLVIAAVWLLLSAVHLGLSLRSVPGVYYDEAIQAVPAQDYLRGHRRTTTPPQVTSIEIQGRPFPWMTQPYMGALKSQLLIPAFAAFGSTPEVLRRTTTLWALLAILVTMLFADRLLGTFAACLVGGLLAFDPTWLFVARHDWGSVALALLLRMGALTVALRAWRTGSGRDATLAGLLAGLSLDNKIDAAAFALGTGLALLAIRPDGVRALLTERWRQLAGATCGAALGALPVLLAVDLVLAGSSSMPEGPPLTYRLSVAASTLDGSYFHRLIEHYGVFGGMFDAPAPRWGLPVSIAAALALVGLYVRGPRDDTMLRTGAFAAMAWALCQAVLLAMPGADRVHHALNVYPLPHLCLAALAAVAWERAGSRSTLRAIVAVTSLALLGSGLHRIDRTADLIETSGGRGLWSDATTRLADAWDRPGVTFVCLDWGFHQTLAFQTEHARLDDASWRLRGVGSRGAPWVYRGGPDHVYLVHTGELDVFGRGDAFVEAARALDPEAVGIEEWKDREGAPAFTAIRFRRPHLVSHRKGFAIELR